MGEGMQEQPPKPQDHLGEVALGHVHDAQATAEGSHEDINQYGVEIYQGVQDLLDEAEEFRGTGPNGWQVERRTPSHVSAEFRHNAKLHELNGWQNPKTPLFTEQLRIQETNVVAPYEGMEGGRIRLTLLEVPAEPEADYHDGKTIIKDTKRLDLSVAPDGTVELNSYLEGDSQDWDGTIDGPGTFGHGDKSIKSKPVDFGEEDVKRVLQLVGDIRTDLQNGAQLREQPGTVVDPEKANDMASASKEVRDNEIAWRSEAERERNIPSRIAAEAQQYDGGEEATERLTRIAGFNEDRLRWALGDFAKELSASNGDYTQLDSYKRVQMIVSGAVESAERSARANAREADRLEDWAAVLYDNPPSEAYKERFGIEYVTPAMLVGVEKEVQAESARLHDERGRDRFEYRLSEVSGAITRDFYGDQSTERLEVIEDLLGTSLSNGDYRSLQLGNIHLAVYGAGTPQAQQYQELLDRSGGHGKELAEAYKTAVRQFIQNKSASTRLKQTFLEDIRSGRAAQWQ